MEKGTWCYRHPKKWATPHLFQDPSRDMMCIVYSARPPRKYRVFRDHWSHRSYVRR